MPRSLDPDPPLAPPPSRPRVHLAAPPAWEPAVRSTLAVAGVVVDEHAALGLAVGPGRAVLPETDVWASRDQPHLLVGVRPHAVDVGPWVAPGISACARCVEADTLDVGDVEALPALDPGLLAIAVGWVAKDIARWHRGATPVTWGHSWRIDDAPTAHPRRWGRHPYCGCTWFESA